MAFVEDIEDRKATLNNGIFRIRVHEDNSKYIFYTFLTRIFKKFLHQLSGGSSIKHLYQKDFETYELLLPQSKAEQQKIADFLSVVDKKIQQLTRKQELLEQYKKSVMQNIFSQVIRVKDENGKNYPDWKEKQLSEFLIPTFREVSTPSKRYLAIGVRCHCRGTFQKPNSDPNQIVMEKLFVVKENDLIVNITFAWEGAIAMVKKGDEGGLVSHRFPTYAFEKKIVLHEFFKYIIVQKRFRYMLDLISPGGAGRNRVLSKKELLRIKWTMPLIKEQKKIASFFEAIDEKIDQATKQLNQTKQFRKGLLQQLFI